MALQHFIRKEWACKCGCGFDDIHMEVLQVLEQVRHHFNLPVIINSACRCRHHNNVVGGKTHSYHLMGMAADIHINGIPPSRIYEVVDNFFPDSLGLICYKDFIHIDVRSGKKFRMTPNGGEYGEK